MKYLIMLSFTLMNISLAEELSVRWFCPTIHGGSSPAQLVPQYKEIKVSWDEDSFRFNPDIFKKEEKSFFRSMFTKSKKFSPEISACVDRFKSNFSYELRKSGLCKTDDCKNTTQKSFERDLNKKHLIQEKGKLPSLPRFYTGHTFSSDSEETYKISLKNFCDGFKTNPVVYTSQGFIQYVKNLIANPLTNLDPNCVSDFESYLQEHKFTGECEDDKICRRIAQDTQTFENQYSDLKDGQVKRIDTKEPKHSKRNHASSDYIAKAGKAVSSIKHFPNQQGCYIWRSLYNNGVSDLFNYDNAVSSVLPFFQEDATQGCARTFLEEYITEKIKAGDHKNNPLFDQNVKALTDAIFGEDEFNLQACLAEGLIPEDGVKQKLTDLLDNIEQATACSDLKPGSTKLVRAKGYANGAHFALKRIDDKKLEATIALKFEKGNAYTPELANTLFNRTKSCINNVNSYLKSPNGEELKINIIDEEENNKRAPSERPLTRSIAVNNADARSHSLGYESDIDCETIIHEIMHLLGLVDEYHETIKEGGKERAKYQCRAVAEVDSLMASHWKKFDDVTGIENECSCEDDFCRRIINSDDQKLIDIYTQDFWQLLDQRSNLCEYERVKTHFLTTSRMKSLPFYDIESDDENGMVIKHTNIFKGRNESFFGTVYQFKCRACQNPKECEELENFKRKLQNKSPNRKRYCPEGSSLVEQSHLPIEKAGKNGVKAINFNTFKMSSAAKNPGGSLLHPAHFAKIKYTSCNSKVKKYTACSRFAGNLSTEPDACAGRPDYCEDTSQWLLSDE